MERLQAEGKPVVTFHLAGAKVFYLAEPVLIRELLVAASGRRHALINLVQVLPFLALATDVAMKAMPSTPSSTVG